MTRPTKHQRGGKSRLALVTWAGVYPVLTLIALALEPLLGSQPVAVRTLIMSAIMVPIMVFAVMPFANRLFGKWITGPLHSSQLPTPSRSL